jgi:membrane-associated protease RseP (regulator of RpoE activity)
MSEVQPAQSSPDTTDLTWVRELLEGVFAVEDITFEDVKKEVIRGRGIRVRGRFLVDTSLAYARLSPQCRARGRTVMFRREREDTFIRIMDGVIQPTPNSIWQPLILAIATVISVLFSYVIFWEVPEFTLSAILSHLGRGWAFTLSLLAIIVTHELGHYFVARHYGVAVTLPYLIPFPLSPFGTMGAVIREKDIPQNKRVKMLIGAAGPVAGLVVAIPILLIGLRLSEVSPLPTSGAYSMEGNSLLYAALKFLSFGRLLPSHGEDVSLHPMAFAGWAGLLVTFLNLMPAGQLDGGHVAYALLGPKARYLTWVIIAIALALSPWWPGWLLWAVLVFVLARVSIPPMDDVTPLTPAQVVAAISLLVTFALTFTPAPLRIIVVR